MPTLNMRDAGAGRQPRPPAQKNEPPALYTRYAAAPGPAHPVREPSFVHALLVATWLGRVIDPLPHPGAKRRA
jgi:hypothetical protein